MEYPTLNNVSYEEQKIRRSEAHRYVDIGIISMELEVIRGLFPTDDSLAEEERMGICVEYANRAGGVTRLNYDSTVDIFDAEGILIGTVFGADSTEREMCQETPQGFFLGPVEEDGEYRAEYSIVNLDDKSIETIMEMLAPAEDQ